MKEKTQPLSSAGVGGQDVAVEVAVSGTDYSGAVQRRERGSTQQTPLCARTRSGAKTKKLLLSPHFPRFPRLPENLGLRFSAAELNSDAGLLVEAISSWRRAKQSIDICSVSYIYKQSKFLPVPQS